MAPPRPGGAAVPRRGGADTRCCLLQLVQPQSQPARTAERPVWPGTLAFLTAHIAIHRPLRPSRKQRAPAVNVNCGNALCCCAGGLEAAPADRGRGPGAQAHNGRPGRPRARRVRYATERPLWTPVYPVLHRVTSSRARTTGCSAAFPVYTIRIDGEEMAGGWFRVRERRLRRSLSTWG